jgi:hypothetical protein
MRCTPVPETPLPIVVATPFICATFTALFAVIETVPETGCVTAEPSTLSAVIDVTP